MNHGYWLQPDGKSYWGLPLAWKGKLGQLKQITKAVHELSTDIKRQMYCWKGFWS